MELQILNENLELVHIIDAARSIIWTERYQENGDVELYVTMDSGVKKDIKTEYYVERKESEETMIIEGIKEEESEETGKCAIVTGRTLTSILERRIVWNQTNLAGNAEDEIRRLITENAIDPVAKERKIPELELGEKANFTETINMQITGKNLYEAIQDICILCGYGFSIKRRENKFVFELYKGKKRTFGQSENDIVIFGKDYDNLLSATKEKSIKNIKNVALVAGEGEGTQRKTETVGNAIGLERREIYVDAREISTNNGEIGEKEYKEKLKQKGEETLEGYKTTYAQRGEVVWNELYEYRKNYNKGDTVEIRGENGEGIEEQIIEVIETEDEQGYSILPKFKEG